jgi:hypothetical protein
MLIQANRRLARTLSLRTRIASACVALALCSPGTPSAAATAEERAACTPDVFRLCSSEIPSVDRIVACMKQQRSKLSPACAAVFNPPAATTAKR